MPTEFAVRPTNVAATRPAKMLAAFAMDVVHATAGAHVSYILVGLIDDRSRRRQWRSSPGGRGERKSKDNKCSGKNALHGFLQVGVMFVDGCDDGAARIQITPLLTHRESLGIYSFGNVSGAPNMRRMR